MELENRLIKLESKLAEMDNMNLELQLKVCQLGDKVDYLLDFIKTKFGEDDDFRLRVEGSDVSSLVEIETNPVIRIRRVKDTTTNIVNQSAEIVNRSQEGQDDDITSESEAFNDRSGRSDSGEELNGVEHVEVSSRRRSRPFEAVEPIPGPSKRHPIQKKNYKRHTRHGRTNAVKLGSTLRTHQKHTTTSLRSLIHPAEKRFVCGWPDCGKRFRRNAHLTLHKRVHTGEKPYICPWPHCARHFTDKCNMLVHQRTHTKEKQFKCTYCGRTFTNKNGLEGHVRIHTGERPFSCNLCGKSFISQSDLIKHKKLHA